MFFEKYVPCQLKIYTRACEKTAAVKHSKENNVYYVGVYTLLPFCV